jgi:hypothetical protein
MARQTVRPIWRKLSSKAVKDPTDRRGTRFFQCYSSESHQPQRVELKLRGFSRFDAIQLNPVMQWTQALPQFASMLQGKADQFSIHETGE